MKHIITNILLIGMYQGILISAFTNRKAVPSILSQQNTFSSTSEVPCSPIIEQQFINYQFSCINGCVVLNNYSSITLTSLILSDIPSIVTTCILFSNITNVVIDTFTLNNLTIQIDQTSKYFIQFTNITSLTISKISISNLAQQNFKIENIAVFIDSSVLESSLQTVYLSSESSKTNLKSTQTFPFQFILSLKSETIKVSTLYVIDCYDQINFQSVSTIIIDRIIFQQALLQQLPYDLSITTLQLKAQISITVNSIEILDKRDQYFQISTDLLVSALVKSEVQTQISIGSLTRSIPSIANQFIQSTQNEFQIILNQEKSNDKTLSPNLFIHKISASMLILNSEKEEQPDSSLSIEIDEFNIVQIDSILLSDYTKNILGFYLVQQISIGLLQATGSKRSGNSEQSYFIVDNCQIYAQSSKSFSIDNIILQNAVFNQISYLGMGSVPSIIIKQLFIQNSLFINSQFLSIDVSTSVKILNSQIIDSVLRMSTQEYSSPIFVISYSQSVEFHGFKFKSLNLNMNWIESFESIPLSSSQSVIASNNCSSHIFTDIHVDFEGLQLGLFSSKDFTGQLLLSNSTFNNCFASLGGGCLAFNLNQNKIILNEPRLYLNNITFTRASSGYFGGAIFGSEIKSVINVCFEYCSSLIGGALFLKGSSDLEALRNITFINNAADIVDPNYCYGIDQIKKGFILEYNPSLQGTPMYLNPLGQDSNFIVFYPGILYVYELQFLINGFWYSGIINSRTVQNDLNKVLLNNGNLYPFVIQSNLLNNQIISNENNLFILNDPSITFDQLSRIEVGFTFTRSNIYTITLNSISSLMCKEGMEKIMLTNGNYHICQYCGLSKAIYPSSRVCQTCDISYFKTCYSNQTELNIGYWRSNYTINTTLIETCSISMSSCNGGFGIGDSLCYEGHIGPQCLNCDIRGEYWGQSYSMSSVFTCNKCSDIQSNEIKIILGFVLISLSLLVIIKGNFKATKNQIFADYLAKLKLIYIGSSLSRLQQMSTYLKVLLFNLFFSNLSNSFTNLRVWKSLSETSVILNQPLVTQLFSFDCFLVNYFSKDLNLGFANLVISIATPGIIFTLHLVLGILILLINKSKKNKMETRTVVSSLILSFTYLFLIVFYPFIFQLCLKSFYCVRLQNTKTFSQIDLSLECGDSSNNSLQDIHALSSPLLFLIIICMPLAILVFLYIQRTKLRTVSMMLTLGFLYREYKNQFYLWEFARMILKSVCVFTQVALLGNPQLYGSIIALLLTIYLVLLNFKQPFQGKVFNQMEQISVSIQILSIQSAVLYQQYELNQNQNGTMIKILFIGSQILNGIFVECLAILIILSFLQKQLIKLNRKWRIPFAERFLPLYSNQLRKNFQKVRNLVQKFKGRVHSVNIDELQGLLFTEDTQGISAGEEEKVKVEMIDCEFKQKKNHLQFDTQSIDPQTFLTND